MGAGGGREHVHKIPGVDSVSTCQELEAATGCNVKLSSANHFYPGSCSVAVMLFGILLVNTLRELCELCPLAMFP